MPISFTEFVDISGDNSEVLEELTDERIEALTKVNAKRLFKKTGTKRRFILKQGHEPAELAIEAADALSEKLGISGKDCGGLALSHTSHSEGTLQEKQIGDAVADHMGIARESVHAISEGCVGFVRLVEQAAPLAEGLDAGKHLPLITVETPDRQMDARDPKATPLFAARAAATTLWKGDGHRLLFSETSDGPAPVVSDESEIFYIGKEEAEDFGGTVSERVIFRMDGNLAFENGRALITDQTVLALDRLFAQSDIQGDRRVIVVPHQANSLMIQHVGVNMEEHMEKFPRVSSIEYINGMKEMGNTISATIPSVIARLHSLMERPPEEGDIVLIPAAGICVREPAKSMSRGFGAMEW